MRNFRRGFELGVADLKERIPFYIQVILATVAFLFTALVATGFHF